MGYVIKSHSTFVIALLALPAGFPVARACGQDSESSREPSAVRQELQPNDEGPKGEATASRRSPVFEIDIRPLFRENCLGCHAGDSRKADLDLSTLAAIKRGGESGPVITPGKPGESLLVQKIRGGDMPPDPLPAGKRRLSDDDVATIERWIADGARSTSDEPLATAPADESLHQHEILPILLRHCSVCHGRHRQEGGLDLRSKAAMLRGGKSGPAIVAGRPEASRLMQRITAGEMPPPQRLVEASVKPVESVHVARLAQWIAAGAPEVDVEPDVATTTPDPLVSEQDRDFWAFRSPKLPMVPQVRDRGRVRNPIDAFVLEKLEQHGLSLAPEADRETLLRRLYLDVTGLPPTPEEREAFLADTDPDAYSRCVDRLLDSSPRYGERWARSWLDLAGYADSEGKREQDLPRPHAWRYRDYVIQSLNRDKPYDRFLLEQLAGDELADYEHAAEITQTIQDNLVATGFLRMAPDATWANITGYLPDRVEVIADEIDVLGSGVMGLTLKCARCHSHKFDPIPQRDYYRLLDILKGAFDEYDWLKPDVRPGIGPISQDFLSGRTLPHVTTAERLAWQDHEARLDRQIAECKSALDQEAEQRIARRISERLAALPETLRVEVRTMLATAPDRRDEAQRKLAEKHERQFRIDREQLQELDPDFKQLAESTQQRVKALAAERLPEPRIHALWDRGEPTPTYIHRRGDPLDPGRLVGPGVPSVLTNGHTPLEVVRPWPGSNSTGRRLALARWLTRPDHPLTARVAVNRLWRQHFGVGIVKTLGNFGRAGSPPTHPQLLDWLAVQFVEHGWSMKEMHRLMLNSATYRQSSSVTPGTGDASGTRDVTEHRGRGADHGLYSPMPLTRLDAESLYDSLLWVAGRLDETPFGPPDTVESRADGLVTPNGTPRGWRRLIYVSQQRKRIVTHLENFDFPQMNPNCLERRNSLVAPQALHLMNNGMVYRLAEDFAARVRREAGADPARQVERIYLIAYARMPSEEERGLGTESLSRLAEQWLRGDLASGRAAGETDAESARARALADYCHAIMNSAEFLYVD